MGDKPLEVGVGEQVLRKDLFENVLHILWQEVLRIFLSENILNYLSTC